MPNEPENDRNEPHWSPLEAALGFEHCRDFMYMGSGTSADGVPVYLYKHSVTRRYINLSDDGRAWQYDGVRSYTETDGTEAIREALTWVGYGEGVTRFWEEELAKSDDTCDSDVRKPRKPSPRLRKGVTKHDIFISYSHKDKDQVHGISERLRDDHGILAWLDEWSILPGERISRSIESGLKEAKILFLMLSTNSLKSQWVDLEWRTKFEEEIEESLVAVVCVLIEPIDFSTLPPYLKGKKYITHNDDSAILAQNIADTAKAHIERREELSNKAIGTGAVDMMKKSIESNGGIALKPIYDRVFNSSVFNHSNYSLRLRVLESELESALVVQQRRARTAKQHMDKMQEESDDESNPIPLFVATAGAIQSERGLDAVEGLLIRVRNYGNIAKEDPDVAADLWKDALEFLKDAVENDAAEEDGI